MLACILGLTGAAQAEMSREGVHELCLSSQRGTTSQCTCFADQFGETLSEEQQNKVVAEFSGDSLGGGLQIEALRADLAEKSVGEKIRECGIN